MTLKIKIEPNGSQAPVPAGTYSARITHVVELGAHDDEYEGKTILHRKVGLTYEIVGETQQANNEPWLISEPYTLSTHQNSRLLQVIQACFEKWYDGQDDYADMLGKPVSITVVENGKFSNVKAVSAVTADVEIPEPTTELLLFELDNFDDEVFSKLPRRFRKMISERIIEPVTSEMKPSEDVTY